MKHDPRSFSGKLALARLYAFRAAIVAVICAAWAMAMTVKLITARHEVRKLKGEYPHRLLVPLEKTW